MPAELDSNTLRLTFGTAEPPLEPVAIVAGPWSANYANGAVRGLSWRGTEILRGVDSPIRDADWRTVAAEDPVDETGLEDGISFARRRFAVMDGALTCEVVYRFDPAGDVTAEFRAHAVSDLTTSRAGLTLLHPIEGIAGSALQIRHDDGSIEESMFPDLISPSQPAFDIRGLGHQAGSVQVDIAFDGEIFEMEDQRNWTDASFKTYCRPLAWQVPFTLAAGDTISQSIRVSAAEATTVKPKDESGAGKAARVPVTLLAVQDGWWPASGDAGLVGTTGVGGLLARLGPRLDTVPTWLIEAAQAAPIDLEIVIAAGADPAAELAGLAARLAGSGIRPARVIALPEPYLKSYQPNTDKAGWPDGPTPSDIARTTAASFPDAETGVGMLTNFTELNRCRPPTGIGTYLTHGTSAIVHAADDVSVLQTLEALPDIHATASALAADRAYRLGLSTIGMRDNPYGSAVADNPARGRVAMAQDDPRHGALFGAAFAVGIAASAAAGGVEAFAPAAPVGPFGVIAAHGANDGSVAPIFHVIRAIGSLAGRRCSVGPFPSAVRGLRDDGTDVMIAANCGLTPCDLPLPGPSLVRVLDAGAYPAARDADWLRTGAAERAETVSLAPCAVAFVNLEPGPDA